MILKSEDTNKSTVDVPHVTIFGIFARAVAAMGSSVSPERVPNALALPNDLINVVFSKLGFKDKINAGLVCKQWDHIFRSGSAAAKHWSVYYNLDNIVSKRASTTWFRLNSQMTVIERCGCHVNMYHIRLFPVPHVNSSQEV
jgi:hypothetical protein